MDKDYFKLLSGYQTFKDTYVQKNKAYLEHLEKVGQKPSSMVIACSDSRVDPLFLLQGDLGEVFVVRNVANVVPRYNPEVIQSTAAALKFGVQILEIPHLILLGHSSCAGITSLVEQKNDQAHSVTKWVAQVSAARIEKNVDESAKQALLISRQHCMSYPWIAEKIKKNELAIHAWYFSISAGIIYAYSQEKNSFEPL